LLCAFSAYFENTFHFYEPNSVYCASIQVEVEKPWVFEQGCNREFDPSVMEKVFCGTFTIGNGAYMKRTGVSAFVFGMLLAVSVVSASAQDLRPVAEAKVPFSFRIGDTSLPAGEYSILTSGSGMLVIRNVQAKKGALAMGSTQASMSGAPAQLVFNRYGENYFLSKVDYFGGNTISLVLSKSEREYKKNASNSVAEVNRQPEVVLIALSTVR
jgi:hypothetical protein